MGTYNEAQFQETYSFLDDMRKNENRQIRKEIRKLKNSKQVDSEFEMQKLKEVASKNKGELKISRRNKKVLEVKTQLKRDIREGKTAMNRSKDHI